jgi:hypothetical protein
MDLMSNVKGQMSNVKNEKDRDETAHRGGRSTVLPQPEFCLWGTARRFIQTDGFFRRSRTAGCGVFTKGI